MWIQKYETLDQFFRWQRTDHVYRIVSDTSVASKKLETGGTHVASCDW